MNGNKYSKYTFAGRLRERRKKRGYSSCDKLASELWPGDFTDSNRKRIERWEKGMSEPTVSEFKQLCDILECDPEYLWGVCDTPRRITPSIMEVTGLSNEAVESIVGMHQYGPTISFSALETLLCAEKMWKFLGQYSETIEGINPLWSIGKYCVSEKADGLYLIKTEKNILHPNVNAEISMQNVVATGLHLIDRVNLDAVVDIMKEIKKDFENNQSKEKHQGDES